MPNLSSSRSKHYCPCTADCRIVQLLKGRRSGGGPGLQRVPFCRFAREHLKLLGTTIFFGLEIVFGKLWRGLSN
jgi:hypothetical protein